MIVGGHTSWSTKVHKNDSKNEFSETGEPLNIQLSNGVSFVRLALVL